jgi:filamentous hemagglutinin
MTKKPDDSLDSGPKVVFCRDVVKREVVPSTELLKVTPGTLSGDPELPHPNANDDMVRSLNRQNESAEILSNRGLDVTHLPNTGKKGGNPDLDINSKPADVYSPKSKNPNTIRDNMIHKVDHQAPDIVLNITDSPLSSIEILDFLDENPVSGLQSLYLIDGESVLLRKF